MSTVRIFKTKNGRKQTLTIDEVPPGGCKLAGKPRAIMSGEGISQKFNFFCIADSKEELEAKINERLAKYPELKEVL